MVKVIGNSLLPRYMDVITPALDHDARSSRYYPGFQEPNQG